MNQGNRSSVAQKIFTLRHEGHRAFDRLWRSGAMNRGDAYSMLSSWFHIPLEKCHFSMFTAEQCVRVIEFCRGIKIKKVSQSKRRGDRTRSERRRKLDGLRDEESRVA